MYNDDTQIDNLKPSVPPEEERLWSLLLRMYSNNTIPFDDRFRVCSLINEEIKRIK